MIADLVQGLAEAAIVEARTVPTLLLRDGVLVWRALGGRLVQMTQPTMPHGASIMAIDGNSVTYEVP